MIIYKSKAEIDLMQEAGEILAETLARLQSMAKPGITLLELDREADRFIREHDCVPGFVGYQGYRNAICTSVNDQVVHGIPTNRKLREGDLLSLDAGLIHRGFWADAGLTVGIGKIAPEAQRLMDVTREALGVGIDKARVGNRIGDISAAVQQHVEAAGFSVVRQFVGHGIGRDMHEDPQVPNFGIAGRGPLLKPGMVLAIEPMVNAGGPEVALLGDGWTVVTVDHSLSAYFEHSVAITPDGPEILTALRNRATASPALHPDGAAREPARGVAPARESGDDQERRPQD
ncbi:MAG TPA: type I methionyl aminopeptidase [Candidatus Acidoferrum sp.]|nr:type I methionyl aminopeptidase [Candidatus Acidoferrum sp.]